MPIEKHLKVRGPTSNKIHFGIDGNEANVAQRVGSNLYAFNLLQALQKSSRSSDRPITFTIYLKADPLSDLPQATAFWHYRRLRPTKAWTQWRLPLDLYLKRPRPQVFFSPGHYAPRRSPIPTVVTILDLAFLKYPNLFLRYQRGVAQLKDWTSYSVAQASHIITISQSTSSDIRSFYQIPQNRITVAYPGIDTDRFIPPPPKATQVALSQLGLDRPYILYLGTLQPRKNLVRLIHAFESLPPKYRHHYLVLAGGRGWLNKELDQTIDRSPARTRIKLPGYIDAAQLPALYAGAATAAFIGLDEGFGLPAAEAIACGTLPVVANTGALPEVVGRTGVTVDPFSVTAIKHGIISVLEMSSPQKAKRLEACQGHIRQFTWKSTATKVMEVLNALTL